MAGHHWADRQTVGTEPHEVSAELDMSYPPEPIIPIFVNGEPVADLTWTEFEKLYFKMCTARSQYTMEQELLNGVSSEAE